VSEFAYPLLLARDDAIMSPASVVEIEVQWDHANRATWGCTERGSPYRSTEAGRGL